MDLRKDESLNALAEAGNVAQFVSYMPDETGIPRQTFSRVRGHAANHNLGPIDNAVRTLLRASADQMVNVRSYAPDDPRSREFVYGISDADEAAAHICRLSADGLHTILNETIDVRDGGVSGVLQGNVVEFAPDDTPRCVEKPGVASLPASIGLRLLELVYGFPPELPTRRGRVEFSIHPRPTGWKGTNTLLWEWEEDDLGQSDPMSAWPNRFSQHIGDKAYGLLMAHLAGLSVPRTTVIPRRIAPFSFGTATGSTEVWMRTCPREQEPGRFTTTRGWTDPFSLLAKEDPNGSVISSVLSQSGVLANFSGASLTDQDGIVVIEGVGGAGDEFMLGNRAPEQLPEQVTADVSAVTDEARSVFGPVRTEWAHDGHKAWILQLHVGNSTNSAGILVPGEASNWSSFDVANGLAALRHHIDGLSRGEGLILVGQFGATSHIADLIRKSGIPTRLQPAG
jgi:hypothetical protein